MPLFFRGWPPMSSGRVATLPASRGMMTPDSSVPAPLVFCSLHLMMNVMRLMDDELIESVHVASEDAAENRPNRPAGG